MKNEFSRKHMTPGYTVFLKKNGILQFKNYNGCQNISEYDKPSFVYYCYRKQFVEFFYF